jgi:hypothetical protein
MSEGFSVVQVEVKNDKGTMLLYVKACEGLANLEQPSVIEFTDSPWEAHRPVLTHDLWERVYDELSNEKAPVTYHRLGAFTGIVRNQTVQVNRVDVTVDGWNVSTHVSKRSPTLAIQSIDVNLNKIVVLNF